MKRSPLVVLLVVTCALSLIAQVVAGPLALNPIGISPLSAQIGLLFIFAIALALLLLVDSIRRAPDFIAAESGQLDLKALWRALARPRLESFALIVVAAYGISSSANLAEVYRVHAREWHDPILWGAEGSLISALLDSWSNRPRVWDAVYQMLWVVVFLGLGALARAGHLRLMAEALCAVVLAFHLTRYIAIAFPSAGPVFYRPELFDLTGTASGPMVQMLRDYMAGSLPQTSLLPGSQAFPSLHVGLAWCALVVMYREWRWTLWLTLPWFVLNWLATVFLGWHYIVDGLGGVAVMAFSLWISGVLMRAFSASSPPSYSARTTNAGRRFDST